MTLSLVFNQNDCQVDLYYTFIWSLVFGLKTPRKLPEGEAHEKKLLNTLQVIKRENFHGIINQGSFFFHCLALSNIIVIQSQV